MNKFERAKIQQEKYYTRRAEELYKMLEPEKALAKTTIARRMGVSIQVLNTIASKLRETHGLYTVGKGKTISYELAREMACGHPERAVVQDEEGTAFCGMCADKARIEQHYNGTAV